MIMVRADHIRPYGIENDHTNVGAAICRPPTQNDINVGAAISRPFSFQTERLRCFMKHNLPTRKIIRMKQYDYSSVGAYFVTICVSDREKLLWERAEIGAPLSHLGELVKCSIEQMPQHYPYVTIDNYCIMPDHVHILLVINETLDKSTSLSVMVGQMKRWVSKQAGFSIWQKSFIDRVIRNEKGYYAVWEYIENNPLKMDSGEIPIELMM